VKASTIRAEITVLPHIKVFALILSMLDGMYHGNRTELIQRVARYYGVTL
jgi:hypothetical protein